MLTQTDYAGYLQEAPDFAEGPESYVGEFPFPMLPPFQAQPMPFMPGMPSPFPAMGAQPPWWRWPLIHFSWINQFRPWRQPPFLSMWRLRQPFEQSGPARQMALMRWQQQQGMAPGQMPGQMPGMMPGQMPGQMPGMMPGQMPGQMPGMMPGQMPGMPGVPYPGMPQTMIPGLPGVPGMPGQPFPGAAAAGGGRRRRRRRRR